MNIYLDDKIAKTEFDNVIVKANKICESVWLKRKLEEEVNYSSFIKIYLNTKKIFYYSNILKLTLKSLLILFILFFFFF
jgi:hypothetical protein